MPVLVSGKQSDWKTRFGGLEPNHSDGTIHDRAGVRVSGGVTVGGGVERDFGVAGRSSSFTRRQEVEVRVYKPELKPLGTSEVFLVICCSR